MGITCGGLISRSEITELELGPSKNSYLRVRQMSVIVVLEVGGCHTGCLLMKCCTAYGRRWLFVQLDNQALSDIITLQYDYMRARPPIRGSFLTAQHRAVRFNFAREHQNRQLRHWRPVVFTDYSSFASDLMADMLEREDARENITQTVTLSNLTGTTGARHGLGRYIVR